MSYSLRLPEEVLPLFEALDCSPDPVFVTDRLNHIVVWNRSAERLLGYSADEVMAESCARVLKGCDSWGNRYCSESCPIVEIAERKEVVRHFDLTFLGKDDRTVVVDVTILQLAVPPPHHFYLAHILKPADPAAGRRTQAEAAEPPAPAMLQVRESKDARVRKLTQREIEILGILAAGRTTAEIASLLHISTLTARNHIQNILDKLEVHSKAEAVSFAFQNRLI
ncbi:MAG TPA: LuxR C-terminal-related transcriptional regulator [Holophagaceae bacterium]|nr:LuxR C-terminal-related transcriptional regulator [Holophagaceae bacterium]